MRRKIKCLQCEGTGVIPIERVAGYVTKDMAIDAGDLKLQGEAIKEETEMVCPSCGGWGYVRVSK